MASVFDYIFKIGGNFKEKITGMTDATGKFTGEVEKSRDKVQHWASVLASFDYAKNLTVSAAEGINALSGAGITLDSQMHDLSAVAGVTGDSLKQIETFARQSAKTFGTDASVAVEGYKLLLSQLSPELGKYPEALSAMGDCIQTTSKLMGGDGVAAAQVLTTAMNQYGVSLEDPIAASREMERMMNVMAAAGQAGSAELPAISAALQQCGMAAKAANVSFEETNAAIQVLDKGVIQSQGAGVAMRDVVGQIGEGRFVEKQAREELEKAIEIRDVFSNIINQYNYTDLSKRTENTLYHICKQFHDSINIINKTFENNTSFYTFSKEGNPIVKLGDHVSNFAGDVIENFNYKSVNYSEELNSLEFPSYSTNLTLNTPNYYNTTNRYEINEGVSNNININNITRGFSIGTVQPYIEKQEKRNRKKERNSETDKIIFEKKEPKEISRPGTSREDIESVVIEMFRREVELCSY